MAPGRGVLGVVLTGERPVRLDDVAAHPAFEGWPPGHPVLRGFLGVPVRYRGRVLGDLHCGSTPRRRSWIGSSGSLRRWTRRSRTSERPSSRSGHPRPVSRDCAGR
ncbi:GAF domain-containing protein [Nocardia sp. NPDC003693]